MSTPPDHAPDVAEYSAWQTIGEAAAARGVSERTLRKRIKAGEVSAVKVAITGGGVAWRVAPETETAPEAKAATAPEAERKSEPEARRKSFERETQPDRKRDGSETETAPEVSEPRAAPRPAPETEATARADLLAQLRTENEYLKAQIDAWRLQTEAANRTASETAAAWRELLKATPRAITGGEVGSTPTVENQSREDALQSLRSGEVRQPARSTPNAARRPQRTAWQRMAARILGVKL